MYLVVDTWVWEKARSDPYALELLPKIQRKCEHIIIYDYEGEILEEYRKYVGKGKDSLDNLFRIMTQTGKLKPRPRSTITIENFDRSDLKFIQVAKSTPGSIIVSGNSDFLKLRKRLENDKNLREMLSEVEILTPEEALDRIP